MTDENNGLVVNVPPHMAQKVMDALLADVKLFERRLAKRDDFILELLNVLQTKSSLTKEEMQKLGVKLRNIDRE